MKPFNLLLALVFPNLILSWSADDHEIFRLNDELTTLEGTNTTFYSFLGVPSTAAVEDINKAGRKKSRQLHPDKAIPAQLSKLSAHKAKAATKSKSGAKAAKGPTSKERQRIAREANERYARVPAIVAILRDHRRDRYDYFLAHGFPRWRGTGYYYARFRPGLGMVLTGLFLVFGGGMHYGAMYIGWKRHREFVERYISHARRTAWGNETGIPGLSDALNGSAGGAPTPPPELEQQENVPMNRKQKRMQEKENKKQDTKKAVKTARSSGISRPVDTEGSSPNPQGARKKIVAENGKVLIVDLEGNVFLEETTADGQTHELLLDPDEIPRPSVFQTALFRAPVWMYAKTVGRLLGARSKADPNETLLADNDLTISSPDQHSEDVVDAATAVNENAETRKRKAKSKGKK